MPRLSQTHRLPLAFALLALIVAGVTPLSARAQPVEAYTVTGVKVDVTAGSVAAARESAFAEGQRLAYRRLLERLTAPADYGRLPGIASAELNAIVLDVGVDQEKSSAVRYIASLSVRFKADAIKKALRAANIPYTEYRGRPWVVVPVYRGASAPTLWDEPNPWRAAWGPRGSGLVPVVVPNGDIDDLNAVNAQQALDLAPDRLDAIAQRYKADDVVVAVVTPSAATLQAPPQAKIRPVVDLKLNGIGPVAAQVVDTRTITGVDGETLDTLLQRVVDEVGRGFDTVYKKGNLLQFDRPSELAVLVPLAGLADWVALREKLSRIVMVRAYEVVALSKDEAALILHYLGDQQQLQTALAQSGMSLTWGTSQWVLRPPTRPVAAPAPVR